MPADDAPIVITNRVIYDTLNEHIKANTAWQQAHAASDQNNFARLNVKFYGILGALASVLVTVAAVALHV